MGWKEDKRPQRGGWAPGSYINRCQKCGEEFIGDKRAWTCADCAYKPTTPHPANTEGRG